MVATVTPATIIDYSQGLTTTATPDVLWWLLADDTYDPLWRPFTPDLNVDAASEQIVVGTNPGPAINQPGHLKPASVTDAGTVNAGTPAQPNSPHPGTLADTETVGTPRVDSSGVAPTGITSTATVSPGVALSQTIPPAYSDGSYGRGVYGVGSNNTVSPVSVVDPSYVGTNGAPANTTSDPGGGTTTTGYGSGVYGAGTYNGSTTGSTAVTPASIIDGEKIWSVTNAAGYGTGTYGTGSYQGTDTGSIGTGYGSGPYGAGIYPGTVVNPPTPGTPGIPPFTLVTGNPLHILGIGPWNPRRVWHGAANYGVGKGKAPARPALQLPGVQSKSFTLRMDGGAEATVSCQFARNNAVVIEEMATDLWWRRKDPVTGQLEIIGRFNTSHNDLTKADDGTLSSALQFQDYRIVLGNRMVMKYLTTIYKDGKVEDQSSIWAKGTSVTHIMKFAVPTDQGIDLSALDDPDICGITTAAFDLPPSNTITDTFAALLAVSSKYWEWWVETPTDVTAAPKLTFAARRGTNRGVTLVDLGAGPTPIAGWQMRRTSDNYANSLYFQGGGDPAGGVIVANTDEITDKGRRDAQDSDNSITGALANYTAAANKRLSVLMDSRPTFTITLRTGFWRGPSHIGPGDTVRLRLKLGAELLAYEYRVSELQVDVDDTGTETVTLTLGNPLASANPRSQYSPVFKLVRALKNYESPDFKTTTVVVPPTAPTT